MMDSKEGFWLYFDKNEKEDRALEEIRRMVRGYFTEEVLSPYYSNAQYNLFSVDVGESIPDEKFKIAHPDTRVCSVSGKFKYLNAPKDVTVNGDQVYFQRKLVFVNFEPGKNGRNFLAYRLTFGVRDSNDLMERFTNDPIAKDIIF